MERDKDKGEYRLIAAAEEGPRREAHDDRNSSKLEAFTGLQGSARSPRKQVRGKLIGGNAMRSILAVCLLIVPCVSANAAPRGHHAKSRYVIVRPSQAVVPSYVAPSGTRIYRDDSVPGGFRTDHDPVPSYNDPSKYGGA